MIIENETMPGLWGKMMRGTVTAGILLVILGAVWGAILGLLILSLKIGASILSLVGL